MTEEQGKALGVLHMQKNPWALLSYRTLAASHFFPFKTRVASESDSWDMSGFISAKVLQSSHKPMKSCLLLLTTKETTYCFVGGFFIKSVFMFYFSLQTWSSFNRLVRKTVDTTLCVLGNKSIFWWSTTPISLLCNCAFPMSCFP